MRGSLGAARVLAFLLTAKSKGTTGSIYATQGSVFMEMSCGCHSHFNQEVRDFFISNLAMQGKKAETKRDHRGELVESVSVSNSLKQRSKIIGDSAGKKNRKASLACQDVKPYEKQQRGGRQSITRTEDQPVLRRNRG